ncbi:MAG TPA: 4-hydroxythreonine-4-phosphate dehydrogenase PdxA [Verrucomicrobiales bacterium]|nr:4-hydroxythreonine-4-phosphate dehydrogenase PdxA [Verrucomicrobiales bacterium]
MSSDLPVIGITLGDPAGIGPEIIRAALASSRLDPRFRYRLLGGETSSGRFCPGHPTEDSARAALDSLHESVRLLRQGTIAAVVNAPVSKHRLQPLGFAFPGQTEFYAKAFRTTDFAMMLAGPHLTVALATCHVPLALVPGLLSIEAILRTGRLLAAYLERQSPESAVQPRILVPGLNPHAGENGTIGREEIDVVAPAVGRLAEEWEGRVGFEGPVSPDAVFRRAVAERAAVLCLYHDQGLIPLKLLDFDEGVNHTLGLPVIRTSPDHGTAFDLAGRGLASPASMIAAINFAARIAASRSTGPRGL